MLETTSEMIYNLSLSIENSPTPIYARLKQAIGEKINSGEWQENQRVPSESEIVKALNISRMTVNRALRELTAQGILMRQQGVGTFVAKKKTHSALSEVHNIATEIAERGHQHTSKLLNISRSTATMEEAINLGVRKNHNIFRSSILHFENEVPIQLEERIVNATIAPEYDQQDFQKRTAYDYLMKIAPMTEGEHLVEAVLAVPEECELLQIQASEPCIQIKRRTWSNDQLITTARLLSPGSRFHLFGRFDN